jgi:hypothetical protein
MVKAGLLDNDRKAQPHGFGLTESGRTLADQLSSGTI